MLIPATARRILRTTGTAGNILCGHHRLYLTSTTTVSGFQRSRRQCQRKRRNVVPKRTEENSGLEGNTETLTRKTYCCDCVSYAEGCECCNHENNFAEGWYSPYTRKRAPRSINKNNDCNFYEAGEPTVHKVEWREPKLSRRQRRLLKRL